MVQLNVALSRSIHVYGEHRILQVRAEAFNLSNHMNPGSPVTNLSSSTSGQVLSDISGITGWTQAILVYPACDEVRF